MKYLLWPFIILVFFGMNNQVYGLGFNDFWEENDTDSYQTIRDSIKKIASRNPERVLHLADSGLNIAKKKQDSFYWAWFTNQKGVAHFHQGQFKEALHFFQKGLGISKRIDSQKLSYKGANNTGVIYDKLKKFDSAIRYYHKALRIVNKLNLKYNRPVILNNIGNNYQSKRQYKTALSYYYEALNAYHKMDTFNTNTRRVYENLGHAHKSLENYAKAKKYFYKAIESGDQPRESLKANVLSGLVSVYLSQDSLSKASRFVNKAFSLHKKVGNKFKLANDYNDLARLALLENKPRKAMAYTDTVFSLAKANNYNHTLNMIPLLRGRALLQLKEYDKAIDSLKKAIQMADPQNDKELLINARGYLKSIYLKLNDYKAAFNIMEEQNQDIEGLYKSRYKKDIQGLKTQYQLRRQRQKIKLLKKENNINKLQGERQRDYIYAMSIGLILILVAVGILYKLYRNNRIANDKLKAQNELITQQNEDLQKAHEKTKNASRAKSDFLASMSHEIRTPMNGVMGMTELLNQTNLNQNQQEYLNTIRNSSETLLTVINDVLDLSRAEQGKVSIKNRVFNIRQFIKEVEALFRRDIEQKGITLTYEIDPQVPEELMGDHSRIRQILINLVSNAKKFVKQGQGQIKIMVKDQSNPDEQKEGKRIIQFAVEDTGKGIDAHKKNEIFQAFKQIDSDDEIETKGLGLGLSISNKLVEKMNGHMALESELGKGSTFYFTLPLQEVREGESYSSEPLDDKKEVFDTDLANRYDLKIMVAEDNLINQKLITNFLEKFGFQPVAVEDGNEVIEELKNKPDSYNLILMDVQMPNKDGIQATKVIRNELELKQSPVIIALTADAMEGARERYQEAGMDDYVSKPFKIEAIKDLLERWGAHLSKTKT